jgi:hypothetical protein
MSDPPGIDSLFYYGKRPPAYTVIAGRVVATIGHGRPWAADPQHIKQIYQRLLPSVHRMWPPDYFSATMACFSLTRIYIWPALAEVWSNPLWSL